MALENYRITEFQEKTQVDNGDYVLIDSATDGTHKYQLSRIPAQASAEVAAAVAAEETAREAADAAEVTARNAAISAAISDEVTTRNAAIAANVDDTLAVSGKAADAKKTGDEIADLKSDLTQIDNRFEIEEHKSNNLLNPANVNAGYYWTDGWHSSASYVNTGKIPCEYGKEYTCQVGVQLDAQNRAISSARFIIYYGQDGATVVASGAYISTITPPEGAYYFISSYNVSSVEAWLAVHPMVVESAVKVDYEEYFAPYTTTYLNDDCINPEYIEEISRDVITESIHHKNGLVNLFDINSDNHGTTEELQDMFGYSIQFRGDITTFNGIIIAHGYQQTMGGYVKITSTDFEYYLGDEENPRLSEAHGLTIQDYIAVRIDAKSDIQADFTVYTNGGTYTKTNQTWDVRKGQLSARSVGTNVLTDCVLSYNCKGWSAPIHLYGDSYFGVYADKWTKYLVDAGFTDNLQNGYPGRQSAMALLVAKIVLANSNPGKIIWCLGMNDGDDEGETDASWLACIEELSDICEERGIELILATIPNVPTVDNMAKNAYVRNSGKRYIDFASAVGASTGTTWYTGMLSNDGVHPTTTGAIALFNQAIADVPELMQ